MNWTTTITIITLLAAGWYGLHIWAQIAYGYACFKRKHYVEQMRHLLELRRRLSKCEGQRGFYEAKRKLGSIISETRAELELTDWVREKRKRQRKEGK